MNEQRLRKAVSDVSSEIEKYKTLEVVATIDEVKQAECECCGLEEDCTPDYITKVRGSHSGSWVCGLCSDVVKEKLVRSPEIAMQEAVSSHRDFCQKFNSTTRLNPKLSLTCAMRDIAKRNSEKRNKNLPLTPKVVRSTSCFPRIDLKH